MPTLIFILSRTEEVLIRDPPPARHCAGCKDEEGRGEGGSWDEETITALCGDRGRSYSRVRWGEGQAGKAVRGGPWGLEEGRSRSPGGEKGVGPPGKGPPGMESIDKFGTSG